MLFKTMVVNLWLLMLLFHVNDSSDFFNRCLSCKCDYADTNLELNFQLPPVNDELNLTTRNDKDKYERYWRFKKANESLQSARIEMHAFSPNNKEALNKKFDLVVQKNHEFYKELLSSIFFDRRAGVSIFTIIISYLFSTTMKEKDDSTLPYCLKKYLGSFIDASEWTVANPNVQIPICEFPYDSFYFFAKIPINFIGNLEFRDLHWSSIQNIHFGEWKHEIALLDIEGPINFSSNQLFAKHLNRVVIDSAVKNLEFPPDFDIEKLIFLISDFNKIDWRFVYLPRVGELVLKNGNRFNYTYKGWGVGEQFNDLKRAHSVEILTLVDFRIQHLNLSNFINLRHLTICRCVLDTNDCILVPHAISITMQFSEVSSNVALFESTKFFTTITELKYIFEYTFDNPTYVLNYPKNLKKLHLHFGSEKQIDWTSNLNHEKLPLLHTLYVTYDTYEGYLNENEMVQSFLDDLISESGPIFNLHFALLRPLVEDDNGVYNLFEVQSGKFRNGIAITKLDKTTVLEYEVFNKTAFPFISI